INYARYPLSPRIQTLRAILNKLEQPPRLVVQIIRLVPSSEGGSRPRADSLHRYQTSDFIHEMKSDTRPPMTLDNAARARVVKAIARSRVSPSRPPRAKFAGGRCQIAVLGFEKDCISIAICFGFAGPCRAFSAGLSDAAAALPLAANVYIPSF